MKTAERILVTSLDLFNEHGENGVTSVDIAMELDISPGNLYYHYKGKEVIVAALFDLFKERMGKILLTPEEETLEVADFFYFLLLVLETAHLFRFLYRDPGDMADKHPLVYKRFKRIILDKESRFRSLLTHFYQQGQFSLPPEDLEPVIDFIGLIFTQGQNYYLLKGADINEDEPVYKSLGMILFALVPYLRLAPDDIESLKRSIDQQTLGE